MVRELEKASEPTVKMMQKEKRDWACQGEGGGEEERWCENRRESEPMAELMRKEKKEKMGQGEGGGEGERWCENRRKKVSQWWL